MWALIALALAAAAVLALAFLVAEAIAGDE